MKRPYIYVALINDEMVGSYMVSSKFRGQGIGKFMGEHSIKTAKELGFIAMQFNIAVSTNYNTIKLWQSLGISNYCYYTTSL